MTYVRTFEDFSPPARYDQIPFTSVVIKESETLDGTYSTIDTILLALFDPDPANPASRDLTTANAVYDPAWYALHWTDGTGAEFVSDPIFSGDVTTDLDYVRLLVGDTDPEDRLLTDEEIGALVADRTAIDTDGLEMVNAMAAAADACASIAAKFGRSFNFSEDGQAFQVAARVGHYLALETKLRARSGGQSVPFSELNTT